MKLLLYCTKAEPKLFNIRFGNVILNGKIVVECDCDLVEEIAYSKLHREWENDYYHLFYTFKVGDISDDSCLKDVELLKYLKPKEANGSTCGYALHISNVKLLNEDDRNRFSSFNCFYLDKEGFKPIRKAPQNMMKVYYCDGENVNQEEYILISIRSEHLKKIGNGEKTIEVRRKILKSLKELIK